MKKLSLLTIVALLFAVTATIRAEEGKKVELKGKITCGKCDLGKSTKCDTVIVVTKDGKDTIYHFDAASHKKYHGKICSEGKDGEVKATCKKVGEKFVIAVDDLKFAD